MGKMSFNGEATRWTGEWFLPNCEVKHPGFLEYQPDTGLKLTLMSEGFESPWIQEIQPSKRFAGGGNCIVKKIRERGPYKAVYGEARGQLITLFDVGDLGFSVPHFPEKNVAESVFKPSSMILGAHVPSWEAKVVRHLDVAIDYLHYWLQDTVWLNVGIEVPAGPNRRGYFLEAKPRAITDETPVLTLEDGTRFSIHDVGTFPILKPLPERYEACATLSTILRIQGVDEYSSVASFEKYIREVKSLISVCLDRPCEPHAVFLEIDTSDRPQGVRLISPSQGSTQLPQHDEGEIYELARCYNRNDFRSYFEKWFTLYKTHSSVLNLLNGFVGNRRKDFFESEVILSHTMIEAYHSSEYGSKRNDLLEKTLASVSRMHGGSFNQNGKNVTSLMRALDLCYRLPETIQNKLVSDVEKWASTLVKARNDITHEGELRKVGVLESVAAARIAVAVLTIHILIHLEVDVQSIECSITERRTSLKDARDRAREYFS